MEIEAKYYDGVSSKEHIVTLNFTKDKIKIKELNKICPLKDIKITPSLCNTPAVIYFKNGAKAKIEDSQKFETIFKEIGKKRGFVSKLERSNKFVIFSIITIITIVVFFLTIGADSSANFLAKILPQNSLDYISKRAFKEVDKKYLHPSNLSKEKQEEIREIFAKITNNNPRYKLHFRSAPKLGPNAFALPSGDIVIFDTLVLLDRDKNLRGVAGVLAHEKAHVVYQHALKGAIKASVAMAIVSYVSGDFSFIVSALPALLITTGYTRAYEKEADNYAKKELKKLNISTKPLANLFKEMDIYMKKRDKDSNITIPSWFSTHPDTKNRVEFFSK